MADRPRRALALLTRPGFRVAAGLLSAFYLLAAAAPFVAPEPPELMHRESFYRPPQPLHWRDDAGRWHARPFVYGTKLADAREWRYREDRSHIVPLNWLVRGAAYELVPGVRADVHLFGAPGEHVFVLGADAFGRDEFSRLLYGARVSLVVGLAGIVISFALGTLFGTLAGYAGGWVDTVIMRFSELLLSVPALYLIMALRCAFPTSLPGASAYFMIVVILAFIGWAGLARVMRGMVRSIRQAEYVLAAESLGAGPLRIMMRHILPNTMSFVIVAATAAVPGYILGEVFLSFLGLGVQEPAASWGNMLGQARSLRVLTSFPWLLAAPAIAIFVTVLTFNVLGDTLRDALDPRGARESGLR
jgi:peptide/nickel transport system permease protein